MANYWILKLRSGDEIKVKPSSVQHIKQYMTDGGIIHTASKSIPVNQIIDFSESDQPFRDQKLLEGAAQAFNEPLFNGDSITIAWVKKQVPNRKWHSYYSNQPSYKLLNDDGTHTTIAFRLPVHLMTENVSECDDYDLKRLAVGNQENRRP